MKALPIFGILFVLPVLCIAQSASEFPSVGANILEQQFPKLDAANINLTSLRKYRQELEFFRDEVLERYNRAIVKYVADLAEYDRKLELARSANNVSATEYEHMHQKVSDEYRKTGTDGELLKPYFTYLKKYQSEAKFAISEIRNKEKELLKF